MEAKSLVSIVIPVYKVEKYLDECVKSVINQTYKNLEIILVDDGSPDNCGSMCDNYAQTEVRIVVIHQLNGGLSKSRNVGLKNAKGEYVYFLDSDDYIEDNSIESLINTIETEEADFVFFDGETFFDSYETDAFVSDYERKAQYTTCRGKEQLLLLLNNNEYRTAVPLSLFKREYLLKNDLRFLEGILHEDELFMYLAFVSNGVVAHCHKKLYHRRMHCDSIMTTDNILQKYESMRVIFDELWNKYQNEPIDEKVVNIYMTRTAKMVIKKYYDLSDELKHLQQDDFTVFKKKVMKHNAYGDYKLKLKCSNEFGRFILKIKHKLGIIQ